MWEEVEIIDRAVVWLRIRGLRADCVRVCGPVYREIYIVSVSLSALPIDLVALLAPDYS